MILVIYFVLRTLFAHYTDLSSLLTTSIYLLYHSYCHELCEIESRASRLTERTMERAAQSPRSSKKRPFLHL